MATELFEPHYKKNDQNEPHTVNDNDGGVRVHIIPEVKQALDAFCQAGLVAQGGGLYWAKSNTEAREN